MIPRKFLISILIVLAIGLGIFHAYVKKLPDQSQINSRVASKMAEEQWKGKLAPNFTLPDLENEDFDLSKYVGNRVVIINFWTTWCGPCRREIPELQRYYEENKEDKVVVVGVNVKEDKPTVEKFVLDQEISYPVLLDRSGRVAKKYQVESYPTTVIIGSVGEVVFYKVGAINNADAAFSETVDSEKWLLDEDSAISRAEYLELQGEK